MKSNSLNICLAIPVNSDNYKDLELIVKKGIRSGSNFLEFRFDYLINEDLITTNFLRDLKKLIPATVSSIFTLRHHSEGGKLKINEYKREEIIQRFIEAKPNFIDIEMNSNKDLLKKIIDILENNNTKLIFSYHDFIKTPDFNLSKSIVEKFEHLLLSELNFSIKTISNCVYKLIFTAQEFRDNFIPIKICNFYSKLNRNIISFCMGDLGILSRIYCLKSGAFLTYGSFMEETAPGQIYSKDIKKWLELDI
ncbi:MAG: type I 3-dehydroquinate dehydratase [Candidatus Lokiarchaeota archaeon]|nr:type I 3-dehydroquinate dehydratase [Candidatus Lokiarchaeota archaeon]